jgi:hypothetical protein
MPKLPVAAFTIGVRDHKSKHWGWFAQSAQTHPSRKVWQEPSSLQLPGSLQNRSLSQSLHTQWSLVHLPSLVQLTSPGTVVVVVEVVVPHGQRRVIAWPTAFLRQASASLAVVFPSPVGSQTHGWGMHD